MRSGARLGMRARIGSLALTHLSLGWNKKVVVWCKGGKAG